MAAPRQSDESSVPVIVKRIPDRTHALASLAFVHSNAVTRDAGLTRGQRLGYQKGYPTEGIPFRTIGVAFIICANTGIFGGKASRWANPRHTCGNELWIPFCDSEEELARHSAPCHSEGTGGTALPITSRTAHPACFVLAIRFEHSEPTLVV